MTKNYNLQTLKELPEGIQEKVKSLLKAYDEVTIIFQNGEYQVNLGTSIKSHYPADFKVIGYAKNKDIFTEEEMMVNYINSFHSYPINYKGKRDYIWLKSLSYEDKIILNSEGNFQKA